jgi:NAD(P)-dependent dehydrogenase (short-subunit alcohol dehydrogenase family)
MAETRVALITGGTDGIGKAMAARLLRDGWDVVIVGRDPSRCAATVSELQAGAERRVTAIVADLSLLAETARACDEFLATHRSLDFLFLNANAIARTRTVTGEGFEANLALGYLSRALMARKLEAALTTAGGHILTVVGLNKSPLDPNDLGMEKGFSGMKALGRWQWAVQVHAREWNVRSPVPMNVYMPGIVKTKILDSEPNLLMRTAIKAIYTVKASSVEASAEKVTGVMRDVESDRRRSAYYAVDKLKPPRDLGTVPETQEKLWALTESILHPYLSPAADWPADTAPVE